MTTLATSFEAGTAGTAIANTGVPGDGSAFTAAGNTGTGTFTAENATTAAIASGAMYGKIFSGTPTGDPVWRGWLLSTSTLEFRLYLYLTAYPPTNWDFLSAVRTTGGTSNIARLRMNTSGALIHINSAGSGSTASTGVVPLNTLVRIEGSWDFSTSTFSADAYTGHSTTPITNASLNLTGLTFSNTAIEQVRVGFPTSGQANFTMLTDAWSVSDTAGRLGPVSAVTAGGSITLGGSTTARAPATTTGGAITLGGSTTTGTSTNRTAAGSITLSGSATGAASGTALNKLKLGTVTPTALYIGTTPVTAVYLGTTKVWP